MMAVIDLFFRTATAISADASVVTGKAILFFGGMLLPLPQSLVESSIRKQALSSHGITPSAFAV